MTRPILAILIVLASIVPFCAAAFCADGGSRIERFAVVPSGVETVYADWTTRDGVKFVAGDARIELKLGGAYEWYFNPAAPAGERGSEGCTVLAFIPNEMLAFTWNAPPSIPDLRKEGARTQVVVRFESLGAEATLVRLTQSGMGEGESWKKYTAYFENAWGRVLDQLVKHHGGAAKVQSFRDETIVDAPLAGAWVDLTTREGLESWAGSHATVELKEGGRIDVEAAAHSVHATVLASVPQRLLVVRGDGRTTPEVISFEAVGAGRTRIVHEAAEVAGAKGFDGEALKKKYAKQ